MNELEKQSRTLLTGCLRTIGFSAGEAESRVEGLETEKEMEYLIRYIHEHKDVTTDEIRIIHTDIVRKHEARQIGHRKKKSRLTDCETVKRGLLIREANINWERDDLDPYLKEIDALRDLDSLEFNKPITFFVGENGCGKSTLLEGLAVAAGFNPEGGTKNYNFSTRDTHSNLCNAIHFVGGTVKPAWGIFLRAETFYNMATEAEEIDKADTKPGRMFQRYGGDSFHKQSHGESFYTMLETDITDNGLYFFDEPEAALSPRHQLELLSLLYEYSKRGAQFIIATHSPILLACPDACIYEFSDSGVNEVGYEDTDIYRIVAGFIKDRDKMLRDVIIADDEF